MLMPQLIALGLKNWKIICIAVLVFVVFVLYKRLASASMEVDRLGTNMVALTDTAHRYRTESDKYATRVQVLDLKYSELKNANSAELARMRSVMDDMNVRLKNVSNMTTIVYNSTVGGKVQIIDTFTVRDTVYKYKTASYSNPWTTAYFNIHGDSLEFKMYTCDTLDIILGKSKVGKWKFKNLFVPRETAYFANCRMSRPGGTISVSSVRLDKNFKKDK